MATLLEANEVTKIYAKGQRPSLNKVSFNVAESEFIAINRILIFKDGSIIRELLKQDADRRTFYETIAQEVAKLDTER